MLNTTRSSGRCVEIIEIAMLSAAAGTAYVHPKRMAAVTMKTVVIERSVLPPSPIGIGWRSASSASAKKSATLAALPIDGGVIAILTNAREIKGAATAVVAAM